MTGIWAGLSAADRATVTRVAETLELRAAEPQQRAMLEDYLAHVPFPDAARVLEVGAGTGAIARVLARCPNVGEVVGIDPSPTFIEKANQRADGISKLTFRVGDGRELPFGEQDFDVVVFHTTMCHLPNPQGAIEEAHRVLRTGAWLSVFDGDYTTMTVALADHDPLQVCVDAVLAAGLENRWLIRQLPSMLRAAGFEVRRLQSHGYVQTDEAYMQNLVDRSADLLRASGAIGTELCAALKSEGRERTRGGRFVGFIAYASIVAIKS